MPAVFPLAVQKQESANMKICLLKRKDTLGPEVLGGVNRPQLGAQGPLAGLHSISPRLVASFASFRLLFAANLSHFDDFYAK
jgi:hypothetical protein